LLENAAERARRYVAQIDERRVGPDAEALAGLDGLDVGLNDAGRSAFEVLALLDEAGSPATMASTGGRFFGFVNGGTLPVALGASWLVSAWDQNNALSMMSPTGARLDTIALDWVKEILGLPEQAGGGFVSGATMANATCLATARDALLARVGWDGAGQGLIGAPEIEVFAGAEVHASLRKALGLVGLGRDRLSTLPVDDQGAILATDLPEIGSSSIVCLQAGNVNSGASDPFDELIAWAHRAGAWVHVDGAFGLWAAASPRLSSLVSGVQAADSWAVDAHKWLNTTYDSGLALVADGRALEHSMSMQASYLPASSVREPMQFSPQSSQRLRSAEIWAVLASLGRNGLGELIERSCALARHLAEHLEGAGYEVLNEVVLNQVVVVFGDDARTDAAIAAMQDDGTCWCGPTLWHGRHAMRISVSCWTSTLRDIEESAKAMLRAARSVTL
jgi:glutamate/tyrosine decarboxylase-like PLP-dependent enzyme